MSLLLQCLEYMGAKMSKINNLEAIRSESRITGKQLAYSLFPDLIELHGDRLYGDDSAIICGVATLLGTPVTVIAQNKGENLEERIANNFGMAHPEGYRKAERMCMLAEKFKRPIITIVDTAGAYPGIESEERGQASSIANCLLTLANIEVPIITIILSEGGSGGALALAHSNYIFCFEKAYYSVISPEGYAEILYKSKKSVKEIIDELPIFAHDLINLEIVDEIICEQNGITDETYTNINKRISDVLNNINRKNVKSDRHARFRKYGK